MRKKEAVQKHKKGALKDKAFLTVSANSEIEITFTQERKGRE